MLPSAYKITPNGRLFELSPASTVGPTMPIAERLKNGTSRAISIISASRAAMAEVRPSEVRGSVASWCCDFPLAAIASRRLQRRSPYGTALLHG